MAHSEIDPIQYRFLRKVIKAGGYLDVASTDEVITFLERREAVTLTHNSYADSGIVKASNEETITVHITQSGRVDAHNYYGQFLLWWVPVVASFASVGIAVLLKFI